MEMKREKRKERSCLLIKLFSWGSDRARADSSVNGAAAVLSRGAKLAVKNSNSLRGGVPSGDPAAKFGRVIYAAFYNISARPGVVLYRTRAEHERTGRDYLWTVAFADVSFIHARTRVRATCEARLPRFLNRSKLFLRRSLLVEKLLFRA